MPLEMRGSLPQGGGEGTTPEGGGGHWGALPWEMRGHCPGEVGVSSPEGGAAALGGERGAAPGGEGVTALGRCEVIDCERSGWLLQAGRQGRPGWSRVSVAIIPGRLGRASKVCGLGFVGLLFHFAVEDPSVPLG